MKWLADAVLALVAFFALVACSLAATGVIIIVMHVASELLHV